VESENEVVESENEVDKLIYEIWCHCRYECFPIQSFIEVDESFKIGFESQSKVWILNSNIGIGILSQWAKYLANSENSIKFMIAAMHGVHPLIILDHEKCELCNINYQIYQFKLQNQK